MTSPGTKTVLSEKIKLLQSRSLLVFFFQREVVSWHIRVQKRPQLHLEGVRSFWKGPGVAKKFFFGVYCLCSVKPHPADNCLPEITLAGRPILRYKPFLTAHHLPLQLFNDRL